VGGEDLLGKSFSLSFGGVEDTVTGSIIIGSFGCVVVKDGSHEDIIGISGESGWDSFKLDGGDGGDGGDKCEFNYLKQTNYLFYKKKKKKKNEHNVPCCTLR
jgi:hypothetical protein